ncbi:hypothetical protein CN359_31210, partial [Bacillus thuringiensis]|uniref:winged helix-turn-helix transcriptional regulator n=1 Tax=Bacillus thuringiensis TaxID=1428 RepID=UPI000BFAEE3E
MLNFDNGLDIVRALSSVRPPGRPKKYVSDEDIILYKEAGWSNRTIAVSMGVSRSTINRRVSDLVKQGLIKPEEYDYNFNNPSAAQQPRRT